MIADPTVPYTSNRRAIGGVSTAAMSTNAIAESYSITLSVLSMNPGTSVASCLRNDVTVVGLPSIQTI